jgi:hypothetical protein
LRSSLVSHGRRSRYLLPAGIRGKDSVYALDTMP